MNRYSLRVRDLAGIFLVLCVAFLPFTFALFSGQQGLTQFFFGPLIHGVARMVFGVTLTDTAVHSDSVYMYTLVLVLLVLSVMLGFGLAFFRPGKLSRLRISEICRTVLLYYLALILLKYGLDKCFKTQFYFPEPNTLFTPAGQLDKDIFFWSSMGSSRLYNLVTGGVEVLAAVLLFFRRTRIAGLILAIMALAQILLINLAFDISVKLFSALLLGMALYVFAPHGKALLRFLQQKTVPVPDEPVRPARYPFVSLLLRCLVAGMILLEGFYPFMKSGNFNDDRAARPFLHGAYEVRQYVNGEDTLLPGSFPIRRFFIHRNGYFIVQDHADAMQDFGLSYDTIGHYLHLRGYDDQRQLMQYEYAVADSLLTLRFRKNGIEQCMRGKAINWRSLPLARDGFHWFSDR